MLGFLGVVNGRNITVWLQNVREDLAAAVGSLYVNKTEAPIPSLSPILCRNIICSCDKEQSDSTSSIHVIIMHMCSTDATNTSGIPIAPKESYHGIHITPEELT